MGSVGLENQGSAEVDAKTFAEHEFDYVICGGGTAGLAIAARLTENPNVTVGVIEAGKNRIDDMFVKTPGMFLQMLGNPEYDWMFKTVPQEGHMKDPVHHVPRGKMLGGSSAINYMMYVRGSTADYDDWATIVGDKGWAAQNMKQYMRKHQYLEPIGEAVTDRSTMPFIGENHGTSGPIHTSFNEWRLPIEDDIVKAFDEATGFTKKPVDPWSGDHIGFYHTLAAISRTGPRKGQRSYAGSGYYDTNKGRPNLKAVFESLVTKIDMNGDTATGVTYTNNGQTHTVKAKREVIVSGGAINSPQILELSGIGDPAVLEKAGVPVKVANKAVGNNFQDHIVAAVAYETAGTDTLDGVSKQEVLQAVMKQYEDEQAGPLASASTVQGFFPFNLFASPEEVKETVESIEAIKDQTEYQKRQRDTIIAHLKDPKSANLQLVLVCATPNVVDGHNDQSRIFPPLSDPNGPNGLVFALCLQYPTSRGSVHITSSDPTVQPAIDPAYFKHVSDLDVMAAGMKFCDKAAKSSALKGKLGKRIHPPAQRDLTKTEDCKEAVLDWYMGEYHVCGSVAMGDALDARLKVKGCKNVRVADASAFPGNVSGNIMSSVYALAERAADLIKEDWDYAGIKSA